MKTQLQHSETGLTIMNWKSVLSFIAVFCLLLGVAKSQTQPVSTSGQLPTVESILRFMKSTNYQEEELLRRTVWSDRLINEIVSYKIDAADRENFVHFLDLALVHYRDENSRLRILMRAVTTLDPLVQRYFPQWIIQDEPIILETMRKIRDNRDDLTDAEALVIAERVLTQKARVRVVQSPKAADKIIAIIIEKARPKSESNPESAGFMTNSEDGDYEDYRIVGQKTLQKILTDELYTKIVTKEEYAHIMETGIIKPEPYVAEANIGIPFGGGFMWTLESDERKSGGVALTISRIRAGFELKIGNDWVNLPFLYGAQWNTMIVYEPSPYEYVKIGPSIPFAWGDASISNTLPIFQHRKLNGTWGATGEYFRQLSNTSGSIGTDADGIGAAAYVSFGLKTLGNKKIINSEGEVINGDASIYDVNRAVKDELWVHRNTFHYIAATATAYYWRDLGFLLEGLRIGAGLGYMKVNTARRQMNNVDGNVGGAQIADFEDTVKVLDGKGTLDIYAKLSYNHTGRTNYGVSAQYFNGSLMGEAYLHIFSWLRAEVKYSRLIFRDAEAWEYDEMIVPGLRIQFAF
jgi:hypothetical protein